MASEIKQFTRFIKPYGLKVVQGNRHARIYKDGKRIYSFACTPKNAYEAMDNNIKDLVMGGYLPAGIVYRGKVYKKKLL